MSTLVSRRSRASDTARYNADDDNDNSYVDKYIDDNVDTLVDDNSTHAHRRAHMVVRVCDR